MKKNWYISIEEVIMKFDFDEIYEYMKSINWRWMLSDGYHVPEIKDMMKTAFSLLHECENRYNGEEYWIETGGFRATVNDIGKFNLSFIKNTEI